MKIIDTHCDALLKLQTDRRRTYTFENRMLEFKDGAGIETNADRLLEGQVRVQFFAIFIPPLLPDNEKWQHALEQVDCFYDEVLSQENFVHIRSFDEISQLDENKIGAVLTLEGADAVGNDLVKLRTLFRLGVLSVGLTWNNGNLVADGVGETRNTGLTEFGLGFIECCNNHDVLLDISHLNPEGVDVVMERANRVIATHSNAREVFDHPRNLCDDQIRTLVSKGGMINIVFNPPFITEGSVRLEDLFPHIDHIVDLVGEDAIGLGSDFDGIASHIEGLENAGAYQNLVEALIERYGEDFARKMTHGNFLSNYVEKDLS
ncbi:dipeptidase [Salinicoccus hispanicus]|uniref:Membrane dipeptidase n=1 Tax=Salinicoccus hispanicus TaxID=157225 RepID=A0A6N8U2A6_9STAP|nr:dipeptidase [Salinicoccus hispanicus]MXQ50495.1 membrane dipeptidase [Salinicoccus hispanicus]